MARLGRDGAEDIRAPAGLDLYSLACPDGQWPIRHLRTDERRRLRSHPDQRPTVT